MPLPLQVIQGKSEQIELQRKKSIRLSEERKRFDRINKKSGITPERREELNNIAASVQDEGRFTRHNAGRQVA